MKVFVSDNKLLLMRNVDIEQNYGSFDLEKCFDKQVVNDFIINNFKYYGDKIIYDISVRKYLEPELYEIEIINKHDFKIKRIIHDVIGVVELTAYNEEDGEHEIEYYVIKPDEKYEYYGDNKVILSTSILYKECLKHYNDKEDFMIEDTSYILKRIIFFTGKKTKAISVYDESVANIYKYYKLKNLKEEVFCQKVKFIALCKNGSIIYLNGLEHKGDYFVRINENNELLLPERILMCNSIFDLPKIEDVKNEVDDLELKKQENIQIENKVEEVEININEKEHKPKIIPLIGKLANTVKRLYIYDGIGKNDKDYENVTYVFLQKNGEKVMKNGYYIKSKREYVIARDVLGNYKLFYMRAVIIDRANKYKYDPLKLEINNWYEENIENSLRKESFLTMLGYNAQAGTAFKTREPALALGIKLFTKAKVEGHLRYLIKRDEYNEKNKNANEKRKHDLDWVMNYKIEEQRKVKI